MLKNRRMLARKDQTEIGEDRPAGRQPAAPHEVVLDGARLAALRDLGLLDTEAEQDFDRYTRLATELLGVPVSLVSLVDADRQFFKSQCGLAGELADVRQTPLSHSFCRHAVASGQPLIIADAREHPLVADNLAIRDLGVIAYAGMPLVLSDGHAVGAFCAIDGVPRDWSERELRILGDLAAGVIAHLELRRALAEQCLHDRLTGLANRALLSAQADQLLHAAAPEESETVGAICIGLDDFRLVNDAYGAAAADSVLEEVGARLRAAVRGRDLVGRLSGDVFAVVGGDMGDEAAVMRFAARLRDTVSRIAFEIDGQLVGVTARVGLAGARRGTSGTDLLSAADAAMCRAKSSSAAVRTTGEDTGDVAAAQLRLRAALHGAVTRGEMHVAYQPIVDLESGAHVGFEALARWTSPQLGVVSPIVFIPAAERTGDIVRIGEWVLRCACAQLAHWRRDGAELSMSVNVSPLQLEVPDLAKVVAATLADYGLPARALVLELTEGVLIGAGALQVRNLQSVRELGVRISLDDFGTGYSALGYLKRFPIDQVKIDRSFVETLQADCRDVAFVKVILGLAESLGLEVVAEGIENPRQRRLLEQLGCRLGQGHLFSPPRPPAELVVASGSRE